MADLDRDGTRDRISVFALNDYFDIVSIETGYGSDNFTPVSAFAVPINLTGDPGLLQLENGNVQIRWGCFACGRYHRWMSVTVRLEHAVPMVIGFDKSYADRIYAAVFSCSVNLLNKKAVIEADSIERLKIRHEDRPFVATDLIHMGQISACDGLDKYDNEFLQKNFPQE